MTPITVYDTGPLGDVPCPECDQVIYLAWDEEMNRVALEPDPDGAVAVSLDGNGLPWCRDARGAQLALNESLYRLHDPVCPALKSRVVGIARARTLRRRTSARGADRARRFA